jgi:hypothetical protein
MTNIKSLLLLLLLTASSTLLAAPVISVYKSPTCGCCNDWVDHLKDNGFEVKTYDSNNMGDIKQRLGVTPQLASCHTAMVDGYVLEGHVPAKDIKRLLEQRPKVTGLTVPGMPMGSPGMEGHRVDKYDVLTFDKAKNTEVFSRY